jgi:hypothetical protein
MEKFGLVKYALLCKAKELQGRDKSEEAMEHTHKGTGFV